MKTALKRFFIIFFPISTLVNSPIIFADFYSDSLGAGNVNFEPTDIYGLTCPIGTASVRVRLTNPNGSNADEMIVKVLDPTGRTNAAISQEGIAPPTVVFNGGAGNYLVTVNKSQTFTVAPYSINLDCFNSSVVAATGVQSARAQNQ